LTTETMNLPLEKRTRTQTSEPSESKGEGGAVKVLADAEGSTAASEPRRRLQTTLKMRRGASAYAQLLQSAVTASIEFRRDEGDNALEDPPLAQNLCHPSREKKRTRGG